MRVAIIDLGTNSVRFDVHQIRGRTSSRILHREKMMIRLGQGVFLQGRIDRQALLRTLHAFRHFRRILDDLNVKRVVAFGTSALREAADSSLLLKRLHEETGIDVKIISGEDEARLIALGVLTNENLSTRRVAIVDIGGGSTELVICRNRKIEHFHSFPLGAARLQQLFLKRSPPGPESVRKLREYVRNILSQKIDAENWPAVPLIIGSSGTVKAVARILQKKRNPISAREVTQLCERMVGMTTTQLLDIDGMEAKRVDMILAGSLLLEEITGALRAKRIIPTEFSLRDGIVKEELEVLVAHQRSRLELHRDELFAKAVRLGADEKHLREMVRLGEELFTRTRKLHQLDSSWRIYLLAAIALRKTGEVVGLRDYARHSCYIIRNADLPSMQEWEVSFVANLCLHHIGGKLTPDDLGFLGRDRKRRDAFVRILCLLRVIDALDLGSRTTLQLRKLTIEKRRVTLSISGKATAGIESLMIDRRKKLFEESFGRLLILKRI